LRNLLVSGQVALSLLVLIGAGLCIRSLIKLNAIDPGFDPSRVLTMSLDLSLTGYDENRGRHFYSELTARVAALPGLESSSLAALVPLGGNGMRRTTEVEGYQNRPGENLNLNFNVVSPGYFKTMKIPFWSGRDFTESDNSIASRVVIVNEALVDRFWAGQNPLGKRLTFRGFAGKPDHTMEVIGVVKNSRYRNLTEPIAPTMYLPLAQNYRSAVTLHLRTAADQPSAVAAAAEVVRSIDAGLPVYNIKTLDEQRAGSLYDRRMAATLLGLFGLVALLLACIGIYGVMSYSVNQRSREIGIRMALGAHRRSVTAMVLKQGVVTLLTGMTAGIISALGLTRVMTSMLFGLAPSDPVTFGAVSVLLAAVALLACYLPARRAASADPMGVLRCE
jgi:predicted permease